MVQYITPFAGELLIRQTAYISTHWCTAIKFIRHPIFVVIVQHRRTIKVCPRTCICQIWDVFPLRTGSEVYFALSRMPVVSGLRANPVRVENASLPVAFSKSTTPETTGIGVHAYLLLHTHRWKETAFWWVSAELVKQAGCA